jgi:hypothetical protein
MPSGQPFPLAVHYYRQPTPLPGEWAGDFARMREMGINTVQLRPQWRWHERVEGEFRWDDLDRIFDLAGEHQLRVVFKFMLETAPDWLYRDYPAMRIAPDGTPLPPRPTGSNYVGGWLPCFDVPEVRERAARFVRAGVERYRERAELFWWHAWNEPRCRPADECACPASVTAYRAYLRERFGEVEALNEHLKKCWASFEDVRPPVTGSDYAELFLWRTWSALTVAGRVRLVADAVREADPDHPVMAHVGCCSMVQDALEDTSDDVLTAATVDLYGSSLAAELDGDFGPDATALNCDWIRSVNRGRDWWINEAYSDPVLGFRRERGADHVRHVLLTPVAHGAKTRPAAGRPPASGSSWPSTESSSPAPRCRRRRSPSSTTSAATWSRPSRGSSWDRRRVETTPTRWTWPTSTSARWGEPTARSSGRVFAWKSSTRAAPGGWARASAWPTCPVPTWSARNSPRSCWRSRARGEPSSSRPGWASARRTPG